MAECPNCGATVEAGAPVCDSCGMSLGDDLAGDEGQDAGQGDGADGGGAQHDHAEGGHQHGGDSQQGGQPQQGQPQGGQPQGRQPQGGQPQQGRAQGGQPQGGQPRQGQGQGQGQPRQGQPQGGQPRQGQPRQGQGGQPQGGQPRQGQPQGQAPPQGGQPRQGQPQQGQYGQPQQGQYRQPQDDEVVAGLSRRQVLGLGGAGVGVLAVGGFLLLGGGGGPAGTAESFVNALNNGDAQAAADLLHPDSALTQQQISQFTTTFGPAPLSVEGAEVVQQSDGQATVEVSISFQGETQPVPVQVRQANGEWLVYSFQGA